MMSGAGSERPSDVDEQGKNTAEAMVHLAGLEAGRPALVADIAASNAIPKKFLDAILGELRTAGLVHSKKGRGGGYVLAKNPAQIMIGDIVRALDGPSRRSPAPAKAITGAATIVRRRAVAPSGL